MPLMRLSGVLAGRSTIRLRAMKTEWARERCERVARRRRQVMEAVTAMRLSVRRTIQQLFDSYLTVI